MQACPSIPDYNTHMQMLDCVSCLVLCLGNVVNPPCCSAFVVVAEDSVRCLLALENQSKLRPLLPGFDHEGAHRRQGRARACPGACACCGLGQVHAVCSLQQMGAGSTDKLPNTVSCSRNNCRGAK